MKSLSLDYRHARSRHVAQGRVVGLAASIADVAAKAGVSVATVSRALRGLPNVAPSTRDRVFAAAEELRYVADPNASRLAAGRTRTVGMVLPLFTQWFFTQVVTGAEGVLAAAGYDLLLYSVGGPQGRARFLDALPFRKRVDGLLVVDLPLSDPEQERLASLDVPVVLIGVRSQCLPTVTIDNIAAGRTATRHLVNLGHEHIALISGEDHDPMRFTAPLDRRRGFRQALGEAGLAVRDDLDVPGNFSMRGGAEAMAQLLAADRPPTAVFAESDEMAIGALKTVRDAGLHVPQDLSLVGFDDHEAAEYVGLTTMHQSVVTQGEVAADMLLHGMGAGPERPEHVVMPTKLVVRTTTGPCKPATKAVT